MDINDIRELYFITDITNVPSILQDGILSHNEARRIHHRSIAEQGVQERRQNKMIMLIYISMPITLCLAREDI
ncbi:MAG: DUF4433 domain-containing protein [Candidatus Omnitrophica bacterium]|nr:DUF4433 domain-containing protein [Candidatus Omnitrophota bacterium]